MFFHRSYLYDQFRYIDDENYHRDLKGNAYHGFFVKIPLGVDPQMESLQSYERLVSPFKVCELQSIRQNGSGRAD